jgi:hypothetical protein
MDSIILLNPLMKRNMRPYLHFHPILNAKLFLKMRNIKLEIVTIVISHDYCYPFPILVLMHIVIMLVLISHSCLKTWKKLQNIMPSSSRVRWIAVAEIKVNVFTNSRAHENILQMHVNPWVPTNLTEHASILLGTMHKILKDRTCNEEQKYHETYCMGQTWFHFLSQTSLL